MLIVKQVGMQGIPRRSILLLFLAVKHGQWFQWFAVQLVCRLWSATGTNGFASFLPLLFFGFLQIMNKVTAGTIGAETHGMVCPAQVCLVFGVSSHGAQFGHAMGELALFAVLAGAVLLEGPAQLGLVATRIDGLVGARPTAGRRGRRGGARGPGQDHRGVRAEALHSLTLLQDSSLPRCQSFEPTLQYIYVQAGVQ